MWFPRFWNQLMLISWKHFWGWKIINGSFSKGLTKFLTQLTKFDE
jgi:hypothetical protein